MENFRVQLKQNTAMIAELSKSTEFQTWEIKFGLKGDSIGPGVLQTLLEPKDSWVERAKWWKITGQSAWDHKADCSAMGRENRRERRKEESLSCDYDVHYEIWKWKLASKEEFRIHMKGTEHQFRWAHLTAWQGSESTDDHKLRRQRKQVLEHTSEAPQQEEELCHVLAFVSNHWRTLVTEEG